VWCGGSKKIESIALSPNAIISLMTVIRLLKPLTNMLFDLRWLG